MKFEYVVSGLTMGIDDPIIMKRSQTLYQSHESKIRELDKRFDNQNLSILYNAYQERRHGVTMTETMSDFGAEYVDSVVFKWENKKGITPELKDKILSSSKHCDVVMIFDEIPPSLIYHLCGNSMKAFLLGRRFDRSDIKRVRRKLL